MRHGLGMIRNESGATMMFVLMAMILVGAITVSAMQVIGADVGGGVEELEADQVFNIANAGVHYAIGKLQASGSTTYAGETRTITNGSTTLGTATIIVNCVDTTSVNNWTPPCASSAYPAYRRVISTGALPVSGPSRTLVAVIQSGAVAPGNWTSAFCALSSVTGSTSTVNGDMVSNGSINMTGGTFVGDAGSPPKYTGKLAAVGSITCTSPCSAAGGILPGQAGPLCSAPTMPTFSPGGTNVTVASGTTYTIPSTGGSFNNITLNAGSGGCSGFTTLQINTSTTDPTAPTVVQLNSLSMVACTRVVVTGVGKVDMRLAAATGTSLSLNGDVNMVEFGVTSTNTPVAAKQLTVWVNSSGSSNSYCDTTCAALVSHVTGSATIVAPNGTVQVQTNSGQTLQGAILTKNLDFHQGSGPFTQDTSGLSGFWSYMNFGTLLSWKDQ